MTPDRFAKIPKTANFGSVFPNKPMQENIKQDLELTAQHSTNLHSTIYYLKTQDCYKLNNSMLKSNITNLQFILDNKPQYSINFDKQQEKNRFLGISVFRFGMA